MSTEKNSYENLDLNDKDLNVRTPENISPDDSGKESIKLFIWETVKVVVIALIIILPIRAYVIQPFYVKGASMEPNFYDHEYLIINEISYHFNSPARGEIVVFRHPSGENNFYIKRLIGLPGERVVIQNDQVIIYNQEFPQGKLLDESAYLPLGTPTSGEVDLTLKTDEYFVMGDNRVSSLDSRRIGVVLRKDFIGKTLLRGWPFDQFKIFKTPTY